MAPASSASESARDRGPGSDGAPTAEHQRGPASASAGAHAATAPAHRPGTSLRDQGRYLLAGGLAGAVSRTVTAPLDRLRVLLQLEDPKAAGITVVRSHAPPKPPAATSPWKRTLLQRAPLILFPSGAPPINVGTAAVALRSPGLRAANLNAFQPSFRRVLAPGRKARSSAPQRMTLMEAARTIQAQGSLAWFRGNGLNVLKVVPESALKFYVYELTKNSLKGTHASSSSSSSHGGHEQNSMSDRLIAGAAAGLISQTAIYPIEILKTRVMALPGFNARTRPTIVATAAAAAACPSEAIKGPLTVAASSVGTPPVSSSRILAFAPRPSSLVIQVAAHVWKTQGFKGFWRGLTPSLVGIVPYCALDLTTYDTLKTLYVEKFGKPGERAPTWVLVACGSFSSLIGATSVYPLHLVRTKIQAGDPSKYPSAMRVAWDIIQRDSVIGLYRGLSPALLKVVPAVTVSYFVYEVSKQYLGVA